jgi:hypothetical protein
MGAVSPPSAVVKRERRTGVLPTVLRLCAAETDGMSSRSEEQPMTSTTDIVIPLHELAHREAHGIHVTLLWDAEDDRVFVVVVDSEQGTSFEVEAGDTNPMHVFHHPYVYSDHQLAA